MKKIDLGQAVTILANVGVLAGILLLVYELNQNRQMMQAQTRSAIADGITEFLVNIWSDPELSELSELSELWALGGAGTSLDEAQYRQFSALMTGFLRHLEGAHYQYRNGLYEQDEFETQREQIRRLVALPGYKSYWCDPRRPTVFTHDFSSEMDALISCP